MPAPSATIEAAVDDAVGAVAPLARLAADTDWLRSQVAPSRPARVDRELGVIYGRVVAEAGPFKSKGRGEFDLASLEKIVELGNQNPAGLKARFTHPGLSADGLGKFLGRDKNFRLDGTKVRSDLYLDPTSRKPAPGGGRPLGDYVLDLATSDPDAFGSSLVLKVDKERRLNADGTEQKNDKGEPLPPLWRPTKLHALDVVDDGDAVHGGFLSADGLPDAVVREVWAALDSQFTGCDRATVKARGAAFLDRYLDLKFGDEPMSTDPNTPAADPKPTEGTPPATKPEGVAPGTPAKPADAELAARLAAFEERQARLEAEQAARLAAERAGAVDAHFARWQARRDGLNRPDPHVAPFEAAADSPLRKRLLSATHDDYLAAVAEIDQRPRGLFRPILGEKLSVGGTAAEPEVAYALAWADRENARTAAGKK